MTIAVRIGDLCIGLRASDDRLDPLLRAALAPSLVPDMDAPPNLSLLLGEDHGPARAFHFLYWRGVQVSRTDSLGRLARSTLSYLDGFLDAPAGLVALNAGVLVHDKGVVLVDPRMAYRVNELGRRLGRAGFAVLDAPHVFVDPSTLDVVLVPPRVALDPDGKAAIDARYPPARDEAVADGSRRRVLGLAVCTPALELSPAQEFAHLAEFSRHRGHPTRRAHLDLLRALTRTVPIEPIPAGAHETDLLELVARIAS